MNVLRKELNKVELKRFTIKIIWIEENNIVFFVVVKLLILIIYFKYRVIYLIYNTLKYNTILFIGLKTLLSRN